ncbi:hypothetical protein I6G78_21475 [Burkholderia glumae]|uniref:Transposase n=1 Tax=Burkholderia glumae TaxID=337 RepID=A0AAP9XXH8_BURGL|nr:hypothetical protein [Burkholderia glumae]QPQ90511.1 hypothetical protein I6H06_01735 [Burkholderia glumae]QQM94341.1 hypothetical protein I6G78_21475 [Burkholderia glumae]
MKRVSPAGPFRSGSRSAPVEQKYKPNFLPTRLQTTWTGLCATVLPNTGQRRACRRAGRHRSAIGSEAALDAARARPARHRGMRFERGVVIGYETIRRWLDKLGTAFACRVKAARRKRGSSWHFDEMAVALRGEPNLMPTWDAWLRDDDGITARWAGA